MNLDIIWHHSGDCDFVDLLEENPEISVLVKTDVSLRISYAKYFDWKTGKFTDTDEKAISYAFIEPYVSDR